MSSNSSIFTVSVAITLGCVNLNMRRTIIKLNIIVQQSYRQRQQALTPCRSIFGTSFDEPIKSDTHEANRVWKHDSLPSQWTTPIDEQVDVSILIDQIGKQELDGGRMQSRQLGVLREDPAEDMRLLMENYTVPSLASAVRDREELLQLCAELAKDEEWEELKNVLRPFQRNYVLQRRRVTKLNLAHRLDASGLEMLRKALMRMPRRVVQAHQRRAGVVLALCNINDVPSLLLEKRSAKLRAHPDEVCLPGGMVSSIEDTTIVATCLREMHEEIHGLQQQPVSVVGVLRCNWGEVHHLVGVAVTPVVCFLGEVGDLTLVPNPDEVSEVFSIPLVSLLRRSDWIHREGFAPIFVGGPHVIWGLTGYIIERFVKDILLRYTIHAP
jgi:nudix motif 8